MWLSLGAVLAFSLLVGTIALALWGLSLPDHDPFKAVVVPIEEARNGEVIQIVGRIRRAETVPSVLGETVTMFDLEVREPGATKRAGYARVLQETGVAGFVLEDESGRARVDVRQVTLIPAVGTPFTAIDRRVRDLLDRRGRRGDAWQRTLRQRYLSAHEGDRVSIVGRCRRDEESAYRAEGSVVLEAPKDGPLLIRIERPRSKREKKR
ncbi:MAG: hypothetical protein AB8I08_28460 [Sandaracinaceae bacterium]